MRVFWATMLAFCLVAIPRPASAEKPATKAATLKPKRKRVVSRLDGFELTAPADLEKRTSLLGASRGPRPPTLLAPALGKVFGDYPTFAWTFGGRAEGFVFKLFDGAHEEIFSAETTRPEFTYADGAPPLEPGKTYHWSAQARLVGRDPLGATPASFVFLGPADRMAIEARLGTLTQGNFREYALGRARVFRDARLWYDALSSYGTLASQFPGDADTFEERGQIYAQLAQTRVLAEADFARADALWSRAESVK